MKRIVCCAWVLLAAAGCSQRALTSVAKLVGARDLVLTDDLIITTSSDRNELRVLDLAPPNVAEGNRQYLPGPNPLEALSIPVIDRPSLLAGDRRWADFTDGNGVVTSQGTEASGSYVYAARAGGAELSVVASAKSQLVQVKRLPVSGPVTALAAFADVPAQKSRLYFATSDGTQATVQTLELPANPLALQAMSVSELLAAIRVLVTLDASSVAELQLIPGNPGRVIGGTPLCTNPAKECLAIATRTGRGAKGETVLLDPVTLVSAPLQFGAPVRLLASHPALPKAAGDLAAGQRLFGVLDEEVCGSPACGGVLAVDTLSGALATDSLGQPMLPILVGESLPLGVSLAPGATLQLPATVSGTGAVGTFPITLLGLVSTTSGSLVFFDALALSGIDVDAEKATFAGAAMVAPDGTAAAQYEGGPIFANGKVTDGAWQVEVVTFSVNGVVPGLDGLPTRDADGLSFPAPARALARARVGDVVVVSDACRAEVTAVTADALQVAALGAGCSGRSRFSVRAGPAAPYVVQANVRGYLGRAAPSTRFTYQGPVLQRFADSGDIGTTLEFDVLAQPAQVAEGWHWDLTIDGHLVPYAMVLDLSTQGCSAALAGANVWDPVRQRFFVLYPSTNGIIEVNPASAVPGTSSANGVCYR
ncbi:MAG: hypothetical protein K1X89_03425 [Myxococcaceae bacterium]|nr:hypothetical protein [Myxococcaceae bacterium]